MKRSVLSFISFVMSAIVLLSSVTLTYMLPISAADDDVGTIVEATADLPTVTDESAADYVGGRYGYETFDAYTATEAKTAGVPEGYSDNVWKLTALTSQEENTETGVVLDFTSWGIKVEDIQSLTIRYYVDTDCRAIRLRNNYVKDDWILNVSEGNVPRNQWTEVTLSKDFEFFGSNTDGTLGKVALCFRYGYTFYVDSITFTMKEDKPVVNLFDATTDLPTVTDEAAIDYAGGRHGYETFDAYTAEQAATAGVPEGYTKNVWKLTAPTSQGTNTETGVVLDFTNQGIKVEDIQTMTIRYYVDSECKDVRLGNGGWKSLGNNPPTEIWSTLTVTNGCCAGFDNNEDGTLGKVALFFRYGYTFYVDSITFLLKNQTPSFKVSGIFSSNMVLQRDMPIEIWGFSDAEGSTVSGSFGADTATTQVTSEGTWKLSFPARAYSKEGKTMTISDDRGNEVVLDDILIGDVWLVGGQSNAELTVSKCLGHLNEDELDIDEPDAIRLFAQKQSYVTGNAEYSLTPQHDVINPNWRWKRTNTSAVHEFSAIGYFFAKEVYEQTDIPQGVIMIAAGGARLSELFPAELAQAQGYTKGGRVCIGGYYNALISPFVGLNCKGMLFFQGESESGVRQEAEKYTQEMTLLIQDERERWGQQFPLYYVQLSEYIVDGASHWKYLDILRINQFNAMQTIPNSTMVVAMDRGAPAGYSDWAHSPYKYDVGLRLAHAALAKVYGVGKADQVSSPMPIEATLSADQKQITVKFKNVADGLTILGKTFEASIGQSVAGFSVGNYQTKTAATATIVSHDTVVVAVPNGVSPTCVNYAYFLTVTSENATLYASNDLPAPAFSVPVSQADEEDTTIQPDEEETTTEPDEGETTTEPAEGETTNESAEAVTKDSDGTLSEPATDSVDSSETIPSEETTAHTSDTTSTDDTGCASAMSGATMMLVMVAAAVTSACGKKKKMNMIEEVK